MKVVVEQQDTYNGGFKEIVEETAESIYYGDGGVMVVQQKEGHLTVGDYVYKLREGERMRWLDV